MKRSTLLVALVVVILVVCAGIYDVASSSNGTSSTRTPSGGTSATGVQITSDNVTVALGSGT